MVRHGNTARVIATDGDWMKVGRKHYLHGNGIEVRYDCNRWQWEVIGGRWTGFYGSLWVAKQYAEKGRA